MADLRKKLDYILSAYGYQFLNRMIKNLKDKGVTGSNGSASKLAGSLEYKAKTGSKIGFQITGDDYWYYVEEGRKKGKRPPSKELEKWIKGKGLDASKLGGKKTPYEKKVKTLAFLIARKIGESGTIKRFGYKGSNFVKDAVTPKLIDEMVDKIEEAILDDLEQRFK